MQARIIQIIALALLVAFASPVAAEEAEGDKAPFNAAYAVYLAAVDAEDTKATVVAAEKVLELGNTVLPDDSPSLAALHMNYGTALLDTRQGEEAVESLTEAIRRYEALYGKNDERLIVPLWRLADSLHLTFEQNERSVVRKRVLRLVEEIHGPDSYIFAEASMEMGQVYYNYNGRNKRAPRYFRDAYDAYKKDDNGQPHKLGLAAFWLGKSAAQKRGRSKAEAYYMEALEIFEKVGPTTNELKLLVHTFLIDFYEGKGKSDEATLHCQAISRLRPSAGVDGYKPLFRRQPFYPRNAQIAGRGGYVLVNFSVTTRGTVINASVVESEGGSEFERATLDALSGYRYAPAVKDGKLVETVDVRNLFTFAVAD